MVAVQLTCSAALVVSFHGNFSFSDAKNFKRAFQILQIYAFFISMTLFNLCNQKVNYWNFKFPWALFWACTADSLKHLKAFLFLKQHGLLTT